MVFQSDQAVEFIFDWRPSSGEPKIDAAEQDHNESNIEESPDDLQGQAAVIAKVKGTRDLNRPQIPRQGPDRTDLSTLRVNQGGREEPRSYRAVSLGPDDVVERAGKNAIRERDRTDRHPR